MADYFGPTAIRHTVTTTAPTVNSDSSTISGQKGYSAGSTWLNTTTGKKYVCVDASDGAAVWKELTGPKSNSAASAPTTGDDTADGYETGSLWRRTDTTPDKLYVCIDPSAGAAVWVEIATSSSSTFTDTISATSPAAFSHTGWSALGGFTLPAAQRASGKKFTIDLLLECTAQSGTGTVNLAVSAHPSSGSTNPLANASVFNNAAPAANQLTLLHIEGMFEDVDTAVGLTITAGGTLAENKDTNFAGSGDDDLNVYVTASESGVSGRLVYGLIQVL